MYMYYITFEYLHDEQTLHWALTDCRDKEKSPEKQPLFASSQTAQGVKTDPLAILAKLMGGSKRNALLKWCQQKTASYPVSHHVLMHETDCYSVSHHVLMHETDWCPLSHHVLMHNAF